MKAITCENCGAKLKVVLEKNIAICEFCGVSYLLDDAIQKTATEKWRSEMQALLDAKDYKGAAHIGKKLIDEAPTDYKAMWDYLKALTYDYSGGHEDLKKVIRTRATMDHINEIMERAYKLTPESEIGRYDSTWKVYAEIVNRFYQKWGVDYNEEDKREWKELMEESSRLDEELAEFHSRNL